MSMCLNIAMKAQHQTCLVEEEVFLLHHEAVISASHISPPTDPKLASFEPDKLSWPEACSESSILLICLLLLARSQGGG